jgi:beta-galactosidase
MIPRNKERERARQRHSFDAGWRFLRGDGAGAHEPGYDDSAWRALDLLHDWSIEGPFSPDRPCGGGACLPGGVGWYRKTFYRGRGRRARLDRV